MATRTGSLEGSSDNAITTRAAKRKFGSILLAGDGRSPLLPIAFQFGRIKTQNQTYICRRLYLRIIRILCVLFFSPVRKTSEMHISANSERISHFLFLTPLGA